MCICLDLMIHHHRMRRSSSSSRFTCSMYSISGVMEVVLSGQESIRCCLNDDTKHGMGH